MQEIERLKETILVGSESRNLYTWKLLCITVEKKFIFTHTQKRNEIDEMKAMRR